MTTRPAAQRNLSEVQPSIDSGGDPPPDIDTGPKAGKGYRVLPDRAEPSVSFATESQRFKVYGFERGYALVVGIANYGSVPRLSPAVLNDAVDFASVLWNPELCSYPPDHVRLLSDEQASKQAIVDGLKWLARNASEDDTALFFFSGHGARTAAERGSQSFLLAHDACASSGDGLISKDELRAALRSVRAGRFGMFLDCCFAGNAELKGEAGEKLKLGVDQNFFELLGRGSGRVLIASSGEAEESLILDGMRNSLFTHYLLRALQGEAPHENKTIIGISDVFNYVSARVPAHDPRQRPILKGELRDNFPIALARPTLLPASEGTATRELQRMSRSGQERRQSDRRKEDRRTSSLIARLRVGFRKAFLEIFDEGGRFQSLQYLDWNGAGGHKFIRALYPEAERYQFVRRDNNQRCKPIDVLLDIVPRFRDRVMAGRDPHDYQAAFVIDAIAESILREYHVTMKVSNDRRQGERRGPDRRKKKKGPPDFQKVGPNEDIDSSVT
jgi:hypothetical protein